MGLEGDLRVFFCIPKFPVQDPLCDRHGGIDAKQFSTLSLTPSGNSTVMVGGCGSQE